MKNKISFLILFLLTACSAAPTVSKEDQLATVVASTLTAQPIASTPIPTLTSAPAATMTLTPPIAAGPIYTFTSSQNVNLRTQPGVLFPVSRVLAQGSRLQVLGYAPGREWVNVLTNEGLSGWVDLDFVQTIPQGTFQTIDPDDVQLISGRVADADGKPVNGIGFAVGSKRTDALTDETGYFYAYLPKSLSGVWQVSYISIGSWSVAYTPACSKNVADCGTAVPGFINVNLPVSEVLNFQWVPK